MGEVLQKTIIAELEYFLVGSKRLGVASRAIVAFTFIDATTACVCGWVGEWLMGEWERKRRSELVDVWVSAWASGRGRRGRVGE